MANSQETGPSPPRDLLAAVVLHTLVSEARDGMAAAAIAVACERDPDAVGDIEEVLAALAILLEDGLAECETISLHMPERTRGPGTDTAPQPIFRPTRAAIRANELTF